MDTRLQHGFQLGEHTVYPLEGRIASPGGDQHVQPKVMDILMCLAEQPGEVVRREVLLLRGWGDGDDHDDALTRCISEIRNHLDDHGDSVQYIQTIPKVGYRLVAPVVALNGLQEPPEADSESGSSFAAFWVDLQRRNVVRVSLGYLVVAWLVLQVGETVLQALQLPPWTLTLLLVLLALGFPIAVAMAWVLQVTPQGVVVDSSDSSGSNTQLRQSLNLVIISALVVVAAVFVWRTFDTDDVSIDPDRISMFLPAPPDQSIAVLRFLNIGGEPHFADGLGEELLDRLAQINNLGVAARTSSWAMSDREFDIPTIAEQLDVAYVLEGSVRQAGDRIRITAQLNDGETGMHVWSQTYDRELSTENVFETQSEIAHEVVELLQISLTPEAEAQLAESPTTSIDALSFYLQGQEYFRQPHSDSTLDLAATYFGRALEIDPRFAMAYAGLCDVELGRYIITSDIEVFENAERACHRALTLDEDMPRVLAALGGLYLFSGQDDIAERELKRAIAVNPNEIDAYADLAEALQNQQRSAEAEEVLLTMIARQPGYWYAHNAMGNFLYRESRYADALDAFTRVTDLEPDKALGYNNVGIAHYMLGDYAAASRAYELSVAIEPYVDNYTNLGLAYFYAGNYSKAAEMQRIAAELRPDDARVLGRLATAQFFGGQQEEAVSLFERTLGLIDDQLAINPNDLRLNRYRAVYNAMLGRLDEAQAAIEHALMLQPESSGVQYDAAKVELAAGDVNATLDYLEQAQNLGYSTKIMVADPVFAALRINPRFSAIVNNNEKGEGQ